MQRLRDAGKSLREIAPGHLNKSGHTTRQGRTVGSDAGITAGFGPWPGRGIAPRLSGSRVENRQRETPSRMERGGFLPLVFIVGTLPLWVLIGGVAPRPDTSETAPVLPFLCASSSVGREAAQTLASARQTTGNAVLGKRWWEGWAERRGTRGVRSKSLCRNQERNACRRVAAGVSLLVSLCTCRSAVWAINTANRMTPHPLEA